METGLERTEVKRHAERGTKIKRTLSPGIRSSSSESDRRKGSGEKNEKKALKWGESASEREGRKFEKNTK